MSLITDLPAVFNQFSDARQKGFLTVMDLKEQGIPLVGTYCTFMPQEIAMAAGAVVVSLCSTSDETIEEAEKDLPRNLCPLIKSSYGFGKRINVRTSTSLTWWWAKRPAMVKRRCTSTWLNLKRYM